jgi:DeoR family transcriptional regulator of aga operon
MDIAERREKIKQIILERQEVPVSDLAGQFDVSNVTLRNDLIWLERKGVCKRLFGKVVASSGGSVSLQYEPVAMQEEKERIGKFAASLIRPGDSVMFYAGSTARQVARFADPETDFIAVTNSLYTALELQKLPKAQIVLLGGAMNHKLCATFGAQTIQQIREYNVSKLFISVDGIDAKMGITNAMPFESEINQVVMDCARQVIVVADHTKVGNISFVQMGQIEQVDMLITDSGADPAVIRQLRDAGVKVEVV